MKINGQSYSKNIFLIMNIAQMKIVLLTMMVFVIDFLYLKFLDMLWFVPLTKVANSSTITNDV